jgi:hypothetical protein
MKSSFQLAGTVALAAALSLTACSKSTDTSSTSTGATGAPTSAAAADALTNGTGATTAPGAAATSAGEATIATTAPAAAATTSSVTVNGTTVTTSSGSGTSGYIDFLVYPGATEQKDQGMSMSANGSSMVIKVYTTKDDAMTVSNWYKAHLPAAWKNGILTSEGKTVGTFSNEMSDGDQSVIVNSQDDKTSRIQLATKHGK